MTAVAWDVKHRSLLTIILETTVSNCMAKLLRELTHRYGSSRCRGLRGHYSEFTKYVYLVSVQGKGWFVGIERDGVATMVHVTNDGETEAKSIIAAMLRMEGM